MDPLFLQINQNRLTENTQRSSDNLRMQRNKEAKERTKRAGEIDSSDMSTDVNLMSDDMLGSMDPDLFGRGGGAEAFKRMWEEAMEEDDEEPSPDDEESSQEGEEGSAEPPTDLVEEEGDAPKPGMAAPETPTAELPTAQDLVTRSAEALVAEREGAPEAPPEPEPAVAVAPEDGRAPEAELAADRRDSISSQRSSWSSLLDHSSGFLLAEEPGPESDISGIEELDAQDVPEVNPDLAQLLDRLIVGDQVSPGYRRLQSLLGRFGAGVIRNCLDEKIRVFLIPRGEGLRSHPMLASYLSDGTPVGGAYLAGSRACILEEECLLKVPLGFHPALYYFAHAFDHALGGEEFASQRSPAVYASYQACVNGAYRLADPMGMRSPVHYFAQAVEAFLSENDCLEPLWTRHDLYDFDRSMYEYIDYLFKRANKGS